MLACGPETTVFVGGGEEEEEEEEEEEAADPSSFFLPFAPPLGPLSLAFPPTNRFGIVTFAFLPHRRTSLSPSLRNPPASSRSANAACASARTDAVTRSQSCVSRLGGAKWVLLA